MESMSSYNIKEYNFILWFFRLLLSMIGTMVFLVLVLKINDTVTIKEGEIVANNPQSDYKAPFEAQLVKIKVKEGQPVKAGDTLLVMRNVEYQEQKAKTLSEIDYLQKKIKSFAVLQDAIQRKKAAIDQTSVITSQKYQMDINRLINEMKVLDEQYKFQKERLSSSREKYVGDSILYKKDMLSKYEYNTTKDANLALKENLSGLKNERNKQLAEKNLAYNNFTKEQNNLLLTQLQLEENLQELLQAKIENESRLVQARETLNKLQVELNKQSIIAAQAGIVNFLYNTKQFSNLINKGDLLVSIAPSNVAYYAKVIVPEKDLPYVKAGQDARLMLNAYNRLENGLITGKVSYIAERKESEKFYALVQLTQNNRFRLKSGFTIRGEIVVQRLPLYKFFIKKIFKRFEKI